MMARRQCKRSELYLQACEVFVVGEGCGSDLVCLYGAGCLHGMSRSECVYFLA